MDTYYFIIPFVNVDTEEVKRAKDSLGISLESLVFLLENEFSKLKLRFKGDKDSEYSLDQIENMIRGGPHYYIFDSESKKRILEIYKRRSKD